MGLGVTLTPKDCALIEGFILHYEPHVGRQVIPDKYRGGLPYRPKDGLTYTSGERKRIDSSIRGIRSVCPVLPGPEDQPRCMDSQ